MLKIYGTEGARSIRPIWVAEELGIEYELEMMPFPPRVFHKEFLEINMLGTVPYLVDGDVKMTESVAMCQYIAEKFGPTDLLIRLIRRQIIQTILTGCITRMLLSLSHRQLS